MKVEEAAEYVRSQVIELEALAKNSGLDALAYLLHVARLEAEHQLTSAWGGHYQPQSPNNDN